MHARTLARIILFLGLTLAIAPSLPASPESTPLRTETPVWSSAFIDTIGVNAHFSFAHSLDHDSTESVINGLQTLGVRHIRQSLAPTAKAKIAEATALGIKLDVPIDLCVTGLPKGAEGEPGRNPGINSAGYAGDSYFTPEAWFAALDANIGLNHVDAIEECNEPNGPGNGGYDHQWQTDVPLQAAAFQPVVHTHGLKFIAPAFAINNLNAPFETPAPHGEKPNFHEQNGVPYAHLSTGTNIAALFDFQNIHIYPPRWPGFSESGQEMNAAAIIRAFNASVNTTKIPYWATETGWSHDPHDGIWWVPLKIQTRWINLMLLDHFQLGIARTYIFNDIDESPYLGKVFAHDGLLTYTVDATNEPGGSPTGGASPTLEYTSLENFIHLLRDPAPSYHTTPVSYAISGNASKLRWLLLQKSNGLNLLAIWKNDEDYIPSVAPTTQTERTIASNQITVTVTETPGHPNNTAVASTFTETGGFLNKAIGARDCGGNHCFNLSVDTHLTVLQIGPTGFSPETPVPSPTPFGSAIPTPTPAAPLVSLPH